MTLNSTSLRSTPPSRSRFGARRDGFIRKTHAAGSSGIAVTISGDVARMISVRSNVGAPSAGILRNCARTAGLATSPVVRDSGRRCFIGPTTPARFSALPRAQARDSQSAASTIATALARSSCLQTRSDARVEFLPGRTHFGEPLQNFCMNFFVLFDLGVPVILHLQIAAVGREIEIMQCARETGIAP